MTVIYLHQQDLTSLMPVEMNLFHVICTKGDDGGANANAPLGSPGINFNRSLPGGKAFNNWMLD